MVKWCNARSKKEGRKPAYWAIGPYSSVLIDNTDWNAGYRLPTEVEWEKAARGGLKGKRFPWGDTVTHNQANYQIHSFQPPSYDLNTGNGFHPAFNYWNSPYTSPVGSFPENGYGLFDMMGNVSEWCFDRFGTRTGLTTSPISNPYGADRNWGQERAIRGGHWLAQLGNIANRSYFLPEDSNNWVGFRCVLPLDQQSSTGKEMELEILWSVSISFQTLHGQNYQLFTSARGAADEWVTVGGLIRGTGSNYTFHQESKNPNEMFFKVEDVDREFVSDLSMVMVPIPAGTFVMGSTDSENDRDGDEGPQTKVTISKPFWMSKYEVTQRQYEELMGNNPSEQKRAGINAPVETVNWFNAVEFCRRLTNHERNIGDLSDDFEYRLPTEAQWEYACRAGTTTRFSYGNDPGYGELGKYAWYRDNNDTGSGRTSHPQGMGTTIHIGKGSLEGSWVEKGLHKLDQAEVVSSYTIC